MMTRQAVFSGIDRREIWEPLLREKRVGLMTNPTGVDHQLRSAIDILREKCELTALYAVEHGIRGDVQAGGKVATTTDAETGLPVFSAYGEFCHFNEKMLSAFDVLVFDIQDVGARFYTYLYSLAYAMEACARAGKEMVVMDRVNPLGGEKYQGIVLDKTLASFVGDYELPTRYGLTIGEYALYVKDYLKLDLPLTVIPLSGWRRGMYLDDTDLPWVSPSPNCPDLEAAMCYVGTCIFEGTNCSEGRGTTLPFQVIGAPFLDGGKLEKRMSEMETPGIHFRRTSFCPTFSKHQGQLCQGVQMHITDRSVCNPVRAGLLLLDAIREMAGEKLEYILWEGEAGDQRYPLDRLLGTSDYRLGNFSAEEVLRRGQVQTEAFAQRTRKYYLYDE